MRKLKVLIAKPGLDGHETGAKVVAYGLRDAGMEVIYTGPRQTAEMIVQTAVQEDVDVIGLSILSGSHKEHCSRIMELLRQVGREDTPIVVGGIIPHDDNTYLRQMGIKGVFLPNTPIQDIVSFIRGLFNTS